MTNSFKTLSTSMADAVEKASASTVLVDARRRFPATGIAIAEDLILTTDHVVERDEAITVILPDGKEVAAQVAGRDASSDLAVLKLEEAVATPAETAADPRVGELVLALGRHTTSGIEASVGVISMIHGPVRTRRGGMLPAHIRTDATPFPGFSGGPLVNGEGQIVGINTSGLSHGSLVTIPASVAWKTAQALAEHGGVKHGFLGIRGQQVDIPEAAQAAFEREQATGLLLIGIEEETPAAKSDLMVGDIVIGIAGEPTRDHDELVSRLTGDVIGKSVDVEILRGGQLQTVAVMVAERGPETHRRQGRGRHGGRPHHGAAHGRRGRRRHR